MRVLASVVVLACAAAIPAFAEAKTGQAATQPAETAAPAPASATPAPDKKPAGLVCRSEIPTGSHFPVKVCTTAEQRKAQRRAAQRAQEVMQAPTTTIPN